MRMLLVKLTKAPSERRISNAFQVFSNILQNLESNLL